MEGTVNPPKRHNEHLVRWNPVRAIRKSYERTGQLLPLPQVASWLGLTPKAVQRWEERNRIPGRHWRRIRDRFGVDDAWISTGVGIGPDVNLADALWTQQQGEVSSNTGTPAKRPVRRTAEPPIHYGGDPEPLSPEEIADRVADILGPLIDRLAEKRNGAVAAQWLLLVASEAQKQGVNDVRPIIDLARELMWRAEHAH